MYVLTNYWSTMKEDLFRIYTLRNLGFMPFVMIYDKQKFVDSKGRWLPDVDLRYSEKQLRDFKICQHMQRWCGRINIIKSCPDFEKYEPYRRWMEKRLSGTTENFSRWEIKNDTGKTHKKESVHTVG